MADLPGNDIIDPNELKMHAGRAVTIDAPPEKVYPYLKQLGCDKAGFYSYDVLERLFATTSTTTTPSSRSGRIRKWATGFRIAKTAPAPASWT